MQIVGPKVKLAHIKRIEGEETANGQSITWATPIRFEGIIDFLSGQERLRYQQVTVPIIYKVLTNYLNITEKDKIEYGLITYDVVLVENKLMMDKILVVLLSGAK